MKSATIPLTKEEMEALIDASIENEFVHLLFNIARKTGRRLGEYYDVQVKDIDFDKQIMVTKVLKRKKKIYKEAVLDFEMSRQLKIYIRRNGLKEDDYVFRKVGYRQIQNLIKTYAKKAGINHNVTFHNFRHYFITELVRKGWSYNKIQKLTGHTSLATLNIYDHAVASDIAEEAREVIREI